MRTPRTGSLNDRRDDRPEVFRRRAIQHVERADPDHRIGVGEARPGQVDNARRKEWLKFGERAGAGEARRLGIGGDALSSVSASAESAQASWNAAA